MFKPMHAIDADLEKLRFPLFASAKLDGIRAIVKNGVVYSRKWKPIRNEYIQSLYGPCEGFDGELIVGDPTDPMAFRSTMSGVMSQKGEPDVTFWVFDHILYPQIAFRDRFIFLQGQMTDPFNGSEGREVQILPQEVIKGLNSLEKYENSILDEGYEGLILRNPDSSYKCGDATIREGQLLKLKRFTDSEGLVIGFKEGMTNANELTRDELGYAKRSTHQAGMVPAGTLGALILEWNGKDIEVSPGTADHASRREIWENKDKYLGRWAKFKYFSRGGYELPRFGVFLGFRHEDDL